MAATAEQLPNRRAGLVIRPLGEGGQYVVKDPQSGEFFHLGDEEQFLLEQLNGRREAQEVCAAFAEQFGEPLAQEELDEFLEMAREQGLLEGGQSDNQTIGQGDGHADGGATGRERSVSSTSAVAFSAHPKKQGLLYWRKSLFDPDRFFTRLEPKIRFFWTRGFLVLSTGCILLAAFLVWANRAAIAGSFENALRWETTVWVWIILLGVTTLHEFAHGLTCKHYGGEVHEIGFLSMFFMPCFYCNVSDAWLFREKSKRLWVTFAGGYFELFLWALAVFIWRITVPGRGINYLAFVVLASCGIQSFFNFNPLIKLDGYYLLSDWLEIPNLRRRAIERLKAHLRRFLWGAPRPEREDRGRLLTGFGLASWGYSLTFLTLMLVAIGGFLGARWGALGWGAIGVLGVVSTRGMFRGVSNGEAKAMLFRRHRRTLGWLIGLGGLTAALSLIQVDEWFSGPFTVRAAQREEVRAPTAGFLRTIPLDEGDRVSPGEVIARMEVPDLANRLEGKRAELREAEAQLKLLQKGPRPEKLDDQRQQVERAVRAYERAQRKLTRMEETLTAELAALDEQIAEAEAQLETAEADYRRVEELYGRDAATQQQLDEAERSLRAARAGLSAIQAQKRARQAKGTLSAEDELARHHRELAGERAALTLLEAGSRPGEITAQKARIDRLQAELRQLEDLQAKQEIHSAMAGIIATPRLREKTGRYIQQGELICDVEGPSSYEADVALPEGKLERIEVGQRVRLKARALPYETLQGRVIGIAESAVSSETKGGPNTVTVSCRIENPPSVLRSSMRGHARIFTDRRPIGIVLIDRTLRLLRTEFWW